jgi:RNA polymerase sigma factor (sigma-70 family)
MSDTDLQLLARYTGQHAEDAFAELVRRHLDLVFSAALRQVRSPQLAEEVAQSAFTDLARQAHRLAPDTILTAWLYQVTRRTAIDVVRREARRQHREQVACELNAMNTPAADWTHIEPLLDEAMQALEETDRTAVLLRYFENKSAREMAQTLGTTEDAAQRRVSRAVERLRQFFDKRGVTIGASGLVIAISANSVQAAPAGLAVTISAAAALVGTSLATTATATATATKAIVMTTLQKTLITATIALAVGTGIYQARQASRLRDQVQTLQQQQAPLAEQIQQLEQERDEAVKRLAALSAKPAPHLPAPPMQTTAQPKALPAEDLQLTNANLYARFKDKQPELTPAQVEAYLKANGRNASSLLAAYRTSHDPALQNEAMQKYPNDPQVAFEAVFKKDASPEEKRQWLDAFKQSAPDNALANYLSALNYFKAGQRDQAVQELTAASGKQQYQDYTQNRVQDDEEAYLSAGYSAAEAKSIALPWLMVPQFSPVKQLGLEMVDLASAYTQSGDQASAQATLQIAANLGQRLGESPDVCLLTPLVGIAVERMALNAMDPSSPYGNNGQTVQDRLNQIAQQKAAIKELADQADPLLENLPGQDWISYVDRHLIFGEEAAMRWVVSKYGRK